MVESIPIEMFAGLFFDDFFWKLTFYKIAIILPISDPVVDSDIGEGMADTAQIIQLNMKNFQ